jgi:hypothetical protein
VVARAEQDLELMVPRSSKGLCHTAQKLNRNMKQQEQVAKAG